MAGLFAQYLPQSTVLVFEVFLTGLAIPADGRREFIGAGAAAFAAYTLNGLFASLVPGFTTAFLHHANYAVAGAVTCGIPGACS
jgi:hypothetical protein